MKATPAAKAIVWINCAVPATVLGWDAWRGQLGANPVTFALHTTGLLALIFLLLSLSITPLRGLSGWDWLFPFRRVFGLYGFFHALLHFSIFFIFDRALSASSTLSEIIKRPYLMVGMTGLLLMVPLAVTSTNGMIRRLGAKRWKALHRLAYVAAIAGAVHYYMLVKADVRQPIIFAIVLAILLGYRIVAHYVKLRSSYNKLRSGSVAAPAAPTSAAKPKFWSGQLKVVRIFNETPDVRTLRLALNGDDALPFDYLAGQYLNLALTIDGKRVNRSYTIASSPTRRGYCELTVKREAQGLSSRHLHDRVREGDVLSVSAPAGRFTFMPGESQSIVMIAGGVGITPLMAKIRYLTDLSWKGNIFLLICVRTEHAIIFREELEYLQRRHPNLHVTVTLTRAEGAPWRGERGRITAALLTKVVPDLANRLVHVCGPDQMNAQVKQMLRQLGVTEERIKLESFASPKRPVAAVPSPAEQSNVVADGVASVTFLRSGKSSNVSPDQTVLEAAEKLGVPIDYDCRSGICGTCRTKLVSGRVTMGVQDALDDADRANNIILSCQARCVDPVEVEA